MNKRLTLIGEDYPTIDAQGSGDAIRIVADGCNVSGFRCINAGEYDAGIDIDSGENVIENNIIENNYYGIMVDYSNNTIENNVIYANERGILTASHWYMSITTYFYTPRGIFLYKVFNLTDSSSNSSRILNNTIYGNAYGLNLGYTWNNIVKNNIIYMNQIGIYSYDSSRNCMKKNQIHNNVLSGIELSDSQANDISDNNIYNKYGLLLTVMYYKYRIVNNTILNNSIVNNEFGTKLVYSLNSTLINNTMSENIYNLDISGGYTQNIDTTNKVDGKPVYYWVDQNDRQIPSDAGYVGLIGCRNIVVKDLILANNGQGLLIFNTISSRIENVSVWDNYYGIYIRSCENNTLDSNSVLYNYYGIGLKYSLYNTLHNNR